MKHLQIIPSDESDSGDEEESKMREDELNFDDQQEYFIVRDPNLISILNENKINERKQIVYFDVSK